MNVKAKVQDLWQRIRERAADLARVPLIALVIFVSAMIAWLGIWTCWRLAEYLFHNYLRESWVR